MEDTHDAHVHSDSTEDSHDPSTDSYPSTSSSPVIYRPPTWFSLLRSTAINLVLPFINGMMLGFGEIFAHEVAFKLGWGGTKVFPSNRRREVGPGVEMSGNTSQTRKERRVERELQDLTSLE